MPANSVHVGHIHVVGECKPKVRPTVWVFAADMQLGKMITLKVKIGLGTAQYRMHENIMFLLLPHLGIIQCRMHHRMDFMFVHLFLG